MKKILSLFLINKSSGNLNSSSPLLPVLLLFALVLGGCSDSNNNSPGQLSFSGTAEFANGNDSTGTVLKIASSDQSQVYQVTVDKLGEFSVSFDPAGAPSGSYSITSGTTSATMDPVVFNYSGSSVSGLVVSLLDLTALQNMGNRGVAGVIISATDNQPLANATVTIGSAASGSQADQISTVTDATGAYYFDNIPAGEHTMVVTAEGYTAAYSRFLNESGALNNYVFSNNTPFTDLEGVLDMLLSSQVGTPTVIIDNSNNAGGNIGVGDVQTNEDPANCNCTVLSYITNLLNSLPVSEQKFGTVNFILAKNNGTVQGKVDLDLGGSYQAVEGAQVLVYRRSDFNDLNVDNVNLDESQIADLLDPAGGTVQVISPNGSSNNTSDTSSVDPFYTLIGTATTDAAGLYSVPVTAGLNYHVEVLYNSADPFGGIADTATFSVNPGDESAHLDFVLVDDKIPYVTMVEFEDVVAADGTFRLMMDEGEFSLPDTLTGFSGKIVITFNETMMGSSLNKDQLELVSHDFTQIDPNTAPGFSNILPFSASWNVEKTQLTITPHAALSPDVTYSLDLAAVGLKDASGNEYTGSKERRAGTENGSAVGGFDGDSQLNNTVVLLGDALTGDGELDFEITRENPLVLALADGDVTAPMCSANSGDGAFSIRWPESSLNGSPAVSYRIYAATGSPTRKTQVGTVEGTLQSSYTWSSTLANVDSALTSAGLNSISALYGSNDFSSGEVIRVGVAPVSESGVVGSTVWTMIKDNSGPLLSDVAGALSDGASGVSFVAKGDPIPGSPLNAWADGVYVSTSQLGSGNGFFRFQEDIVLPGTGSGLDYQNGVLITRDGDFAFNVTNTDEGLTPVVFTNSANNDRVIQFDIASPELIDTGDMLLVSLLDGQGNATCAPVYFVDDREPMIASLSIDTVANELTVTLNEPVFGGTVDADDFTFTEFVDYDADGILDAGAETTNSTPRPLTDDVFFPGIAAFNPGTGSQTTFVFPFDSSQLTGSLEVKFATSNELTDLGYNENVATLTADRIVAADPVAPAVAMVELFHNDNDLNNDGLTVAAEAAVADADLWRTAFIKLSEDLNLEGDTTVNIYDYQKAAYTLVVAGNTFVAQWLDGGDEVFQFDESQLLNEKPTMVVDSAGDEWIKLVFKDENFFTQVVSNTDTLIVAGISDFGGNAIDSTAFALTDNVPPKLINIAASEGPADAYDVVTLTISEELSASALARLLEPSMFHVEIAGTEVFVIGTPVVTVNLDGTTTVVLNVPEGELIDANGNLIAQLQVDIFDGTSASTDPDFYVLEDVSDNRLGGSDESPDVVAAPDAAFVVATIGAGVTDPITTIVSVKSNFAGELVLEISFGEKVITDRVTDPANWTFPAGVSLLNLVAGDADPQFTDYLDLYLTVSTPTSSGQSITLAGASIVDEAGNDRAGNNLSISVVDDIYDVTGPAITDIALGDGDSTHDVLVLTVKDNIPGAALAVDAANPFDSSELESDSFDVTGLGEGLAQVSAPLYDPVTNTITLYLADGTVAALRDGSGGSDLVVMTSNTGTGNGQLIDAAGNPLQDFFPRGDTGQFVDGAEGVGVLVDGDGFLVNADNEFIDAPGVVATTNDAGTLVADAVQSPNLGSVTFTIDLLPFVSPSVVAHNFNSALNGSLTDGIQRISAVQIYFSKEMDESSAENAANYTLPAGFTLFNGVAPQYEDLLAVSTNVNNDPVIVDQAGDPAGPGDYRVTLWLSSTLNVAISDDVVLGSGLVDTFGNSIVDASVSASDQTSPIFVAGSFVFTPNISFGLLGDILGDQVAESDTGNGIDDDNDGLIDEGPSPEKVDRIEFSLNEAVVSPTATDSFALYVLTDNEDNGFNFETVDDNTATATDADFDVSSGSFVALGANTVSAAIADVILDVSIAGGTAVTLYIDDDAGALNSLSDLAFNQRLVVLPKLSTVADISPAANLMDRVFSGLQNFGETGSSSTLATVTSHEFQSVTAGASIGGFDGLLPTESQLVAIDIDFDQPGIISSDTGEWLVALQDSLNYSFATADDDVISLLTTPTVNPAQTTVSLLLQVTAGATGNGRIDIGDSMTLEPGLAAFLDVASATVLKPEDNENPSLIDEFDNFSTVAVTVDTTPTDGTILITVPYNESIEAVNGFDVDVIVSLGEYAAQGNYIDISIPAIGSPVIDNVAKTMVVTIPQLVSANFGSLGDGFNQTLDLDVELDIAGDDDTFAEQVDVRVNTGALVGTDSSTNGVIEVATVIFPGIGNGPAITAISTSLFGGVFDKDATFGGVTGIVGVAAGGWAAGNGDRYADNGLDDDSDGFVDEANEAPDGIDSDGDGVIDDLTGAFATPETGLLATDGIDNDGDGVIDDDNTSPFGKPEIESATDDDGKWLIVQDIEVTAANGFTEANRISFADFTRYELSSPGNVAEFGTPAVWMVDANTVMIRLFYSIDGNYLLDGAADAELISINSTFVDSVGISIQTAFDAFDASGGPAH